jgi:hypothetical protein
MEGTAIAFPKRKQLRLPFAWISDRSNTMLKPIEKPTRQALVHHPSDVLDSFGQYDATNSTWIQFDEALSQQLIELEFKNRQFIRVSLNSRRNSVA